MSLLCTDSGPCYAHCDGAAGPDDRCPWYCDIDGCDEEAVIEPRGDGFATCVRHAAVVAAEGRG